MSKIANAKQTLARGNELHNFIGVNQRAVLIELLRGEEGDHFADLILNLATAIALMPKTYETDGQGMDATVHLHYFRGSIDAWVTEKDVGSEDDKRQTQAFGAVNLGHGAEMGYVDIYTMLNAGVELDLYWTPKTLKECMK